MAMQTLEADNYEGDSSYGEELSTYTASLTSSSYDFPEQHGRRYHAYKAGRYYLPNDEQENNRLDVHYAMVRRMMGGKLHLSPIANNIERALDLGTGTGLWAINYADEHEGTEVVGVDLSPIQPTHAPPNVTFLLDDFEAEWSYEPFDFVRGCILVGSGKDWQRLFGQAYRNMKPGAYIEFQDWDLTLYSQDNSLPEDSALYQWNRDVIGSLTLLGSEPCPGLRFEKWLKDAGFVDVTVTRTPAPVGNWPKDAKMKVKDRKPQDDHLCDFHFSDCRDCQELGVLNYIRLTEALQAVSLGTLMHHPQKPMTYEQVQNHLVDVRRDLDNRDIHSIYDFYIVYGKKPE